MKIFMRLFIPCIAALCSVVGALRAEEAAKIPPEEAAARANAKAYEAAYAKGDVAAMAAFFADDADYTDESGRTYRGRDAIAESIRSGLQSNRGGRLEIAVESVKLIGPEIAVEKGTTTSIGKAGERSRSVYTAIHVERDGKWKMVQLIESPAPDVTPGEQLSDLAWLVGVWEEADDSSGLKIRSEVTWARGGNFLTRNISVKRDGATVMEGWQIIGWDPVEGVIRSWIFDGEGGFGEGRWTGAGNRWLIRETGFNPEGGRLAAEHTLGRVGDDQFSWESNNRTLDGDPLPGIAKALARRVKGN
jgi:uncharacterized protein (TIGR02246 family)